MFEEYDMNGTSSYSSSKTLILTRLKTNSYEHDPNRKLPRVMKRHSLFEGYVQLERYDREGKCGRFSHQIGIDICLVLFVFLFKIKSRKIEFAIWSLSLEKLLFSCLSCSEE